MNVAWHPAIDTVQSRIKACIPGRLSARRIRPVDDRIGAFGMVDEGVQP